MVRMILPILYAFNNTYSLFADSVHDVCDFQRHLLRPRQKNETPMRVRGSTPWILLSCRRSTETNCWGPSSLPKTLFNTINVQAQNNDCTRPVYRRFPIHPPTPKTLHNTVSGLKPEIAGFWHPKSLLYCNPLRPLITRLFLIIAYGYVMLKIMKNSWGDDSVEVLGG